MSGFTPDSSLDLLFDKDLISADVKKQLPEDLHVGDWLGSRTVTELLQIRPLASTDYTRGHLDILSVLTTVSDPGEAAWRSQFNAMRPHSSQSGPQTYYALVIVHKPTDKILATGTVFLERKFLRGLGSVGHIEDIAVSKAAQGKKLGLRVIQALTHISELSGCYKTILNCSDDNIRE